MGELLEWYQKEKQRRDLRRQARRGSQGGSGQGSRGASRAVSGTSQGGRGGDFCVRISKYLKEARALGCRSFDGTDDISVAADWIKKVKDASRDMQITPDVKLTVASRLLEGIASTWWESVERKYRGTITWANFEQKFYAQYYSDYEVNVKRREYTNLKQKEGVTVKQLEQKFRTLARFLPEYAADEDHMTEHFWDALLLDIRDRATYSRHMTFNEVVEQGMLGETQWNERKERDTEEAKKRKWNSSRPPDLSRKNNHEGGGSFKAPAPPAKRNMDSKWHSSPSHKSGPPKCANCSKNHFGKCNAPPRCYQCGNTGHMKANCP
ncbi:unnamed protein product [Cuscuta europaea]|uniref:CCHC-type domain-containing protein n=1 Tax=Cuscuta europaea TaxID=41803 RepID=A0A9P0Z0N2_CUSEU|nr:unnamed protein product [Cuscuta europaea]